MLQDRQTNCMKTVPIWINTIATVHYNWKYHMRSGITNGLVISYPQLTEYKTICLSLKRMNTQLYSGVLVKEKKFYDQQGQKNGQGLSIAAHHKVHANRCNQLHIPLISLTTSLMYWGTTSKNGSTSQVHTNRCESASTYYNFELAANTFTLWWSANEISTAIELYHTLLAHLWPSIHFLFGNSFDSNTRACPFACSSIHRTEATFTYSASLLIEAGEFSLLGKIHALWFVFVSLKIAVSFLAPVFRFR